jgi:4,5-DOPA dioxygenase extradiol
MNRAEFLKSSLLGLFAMTSLQDLKKFSEGLSREENKLPAFFVGHGSPMNALEQNEFTKQWQAIGRSSPRPQAVICVSAHWETKGTFVTAMEKPRTIHDFGGFPKALFDMQYPAPGSPEIARQAQEVIKSTPVGLDHSWGLDHGCWSVVTHIFPEADIPVLQLSIDYTKPPQWHFELAKELAALRKKGVLIIGSGNIVHNLRMINWHMQDTGFDWVLETKDKFKRYMLDGDYQKLINYQTLGKEAQLSIPTPEHYLPLLYVLGMKDEKEDISFFNDKTIMGSIAMTSVKIGD